MSVSYRKDIDPSPPPAIDHLECALIDDESDWSKEYLREAWIDWRGVVIGLVAVAVFCAVWVAIP